MVLVPNTNYIGISKKISDRYERNKIKNIISNFKPKDFGIIAEQYAKIKTKKILKMILKDFIKFGKK